MIRIFSESNGYNISDREVYSGDRVPNLSAAIPSRTFLVSAASIRLPTPESSTVSLLPREVG